MSLSVALLVLLSAVLHASWNAIVRFKGDRLAIVTMLATCGALIAAPALFFVEIPREEAWPWLIASMLLHIGYNVFLANAYQHGELGKVYPLARGTAPLLTLIAFYAPAGHRATWFALMASLMNLALAAGALQTKYLNQIFAVQRGDYAELGGLLIAALTISFVLPIGVILLLGRRV